MKMYYSSILQKYNNAGRRHRSIRLQNQQPCMVCNIYISIYIYYIYIYIYIYIHIHIYIYIYIYILTSQSMSIVSLCEFYLNIVLQKGNIL